jgi:hypothetical protein
MNMDSFFFLAVTETDLCAMKAAVYNKEKHLNWELLCTNVAAQVSGKTKITVSTQNM